MSPWLFNIYMDSVVKEANVRNYGRGLKLVGLNGERFEVIQLIFTDDGVLVSDYVKKV